MAELALAVAHQGEFIGKDFVIDRMVPGHGLRPFTNEIKKTTGVSLKYVLDTSNPSYWPQIYTAFEVRHLVEHRDGKIDAEFRSNVAQCWPNTTWGRRGNNLQQLEKIEVADEDVVTTYHTMLDAARLMTEAVLDWASKNQTLEMNAKASDAS